MSLRCRSWDGTISLLDLKRTTNKIGIGRPSRAFPPTPPGIRDRTHGGSKRLNVNWNLAERDQDHQNSDLTLPSSLQEYDSSSRALSNSKHRFVPGSLKHLDEPTLFSGIYRLSRLSTGHNITCDGSRTPQTQLTLFPTTL